jgi:hypothetical protein
MYAREHMHIDIPSLLCMHNYVCICIHAYCHTWLFFNYLCYICVHVYTYMHVNIYASLLRDDEPFCMYTQFIRFAHVHTYMARIHMHVSTCTCSGNSLSLSCSALHASMHARYMYVCMYACMYICVHTHAHVCAPTWPWQLLSTKVSPFCIYANVLLGFVVICVRHENVLAVTDVCIHVFTRTRWCTATATCVLQQQHVFVRGRTWPMPNVYDYMSRCTHTCTHTRSMASVALVHTYIPSCVCTCILQRMTQGW